MKRVLSVLLVCLFAVFAFACANVNDSGEAGKGKNVSAIFVGIDKQPFSGKRDAIDTIWIYYDNGTFEQYAEVENELVPFSEGVYHFENNGNFVDGEKDHSKGQIVINRNKKYQIGKGLAEYSSLHTYDLYSIGYEPIYLYEEGKTKMLAIFIGDNKQYFINNNRRQYLDTLWMFFDDNRFRQYTEIGREMKEFSEGTYEFSGNASFVNYAKHNEEGQIIISREKIYKDKKGLANSSSTHKYDLNTLGFKCVWVRE